MAQIIGLFGPFAQKRLKRDWSNQDLAELYRVESALIQAGLRVETERGVSDEGEPWFVFCHGDSGEVIVHFARINGRYVVASPALPKALTGPDLGTIVRTFVSDNPIALPSADASRRGNVVFHPAALLTIFVATMLVLNSPDEGFAAAAAGDEADGLHEMPAAHFARMSGAPVLSEKDYRSESAYLVAAVALAIEAARFQLQDDGHAADQLADQDLAGGIQLADVTDAGQDGPDIDLYGLSEAFFISQQSGDPDKPAPAEVAPDAPIDSLPLWALPSKADAHEVRVSAEAPKGQPAEVLPPPDAFQAGIAGAFQQVDFRAGGSADGDAAAKVDPTAVDAAKVSAAHAWLEQQSHMSGWSVALVEAGSLAATRAVDLVAGLEPMADDPQAGWTPNARQQVIDFFEASDTDISVLKQDDGSVIMFDASDVASGQGLSLLSWTFDGDGTSLVILGQAGVIADAMALIA